MYTYKYPRPALTVDIAIFMPDEGDIKILLIRRAGQPFQGRYALPGGFVEMQESLEEAARRELKEETGLDIPDLVQVHTFSDPERDPRGRVVSTCFAAILPDAGPAAVQAGSDAELAGWFSLKQLPALAFDHPQILQTVIEKFLSSEENLLPGFEQEG